MKLVRTFSQEHLDFPLLPDTRKNTSVYSESRRKVTSFHASLNEFIPEDIPGVPEVTDRRGIYFQLLSSACGVALNTIRKTCPEIPSSQMLFVRTPFILVVISLYFILMKKTDDLKNSFSPRTALVGICITISASIFFTALLYLPLSEIQPINATIAIFSAILASIFLGEPYLLKEKLLGVVSIFGVMLIIRPPFIFGSGKTSDDSIDSMTRFLAGFAAVIAALANSAGQVAIRATKAKWHAFVIPFQVNFTIFIVYGMYFLTFGDFQPLTFREYFMIFLFGMLNMTGLFFMAKALAIEKPSVVGLTQYSELLYALLVDLIIFGTLPSFLTVVGAGLIVASCLYLVLSKE